MQIPVRHVECLISSDTQESQRMNKCFGFKVLHCRIAELAVIKLQRTPCALRCIASLGGVHFWVCFLQDLSPGQCPREAVWAGHWGRGCIPPP